MEANRASIVKHNTWEPCGARGLLGGGIGVLLDFKSLFFKLCGHFEEPSGSRGVPESGEMVLEGRLRPVKWLERGG